MDSHGGWIASAVDLAKFACAFDRRDNSPLLSKASIELMHARPTGLAGYDEEAKAKNVFYSLGWNNRVIGENQSNCWHTGSLPRTATILIRRYDGRNFVALLNSRASPTTSHLGRAIDELLAKASREITQWP